MTLDVLSFLNCQEQKLIGPIIVGYRNSFEALLDIMNPGAVRFPFPSLKGLMVNK
jgi:hypothetical protein